MFYLCYTKERGEIMGKLKWKILLVVTISFILFGCQKMNQFTPQEVIKNVLVSDEEISYYAEFELNLFDNGEEQLEMQVKEWRENERQRLNSSHVAISYAVF